MSISNLDRLNTLPKILYSLFPFVNTHNLVTKSHSSYKKDELERRVEEALSNFDDVLSFKANRFSGPIKRFPLYSDRLIKSIDRLKDFDLHIFVPSVSADNSTSTIPRRMAVDPQQVSFAQSSQILEKSLEMSEAYENVLFTYVSPVIWPCTYKNGKLSHALKDVIQSLNEDIMFNCNNTSFFGDLEKSLDTSMSEGNYHFSEAVLDLSKAQYSLKRNPTMLSRMMEKYVDWPSISLELGYTVLLNNLVLENALTSYVEMLGLKELMVFSSVSNFTYNNMAKVGKNLNIPIHLVGGPSGPLASKKILSHGESEPFAINALHGTVKAFYDFNTGANSSPSISKKRNVISDLEFLDCPYHSCIKCSSQKICDHITIPCAKDKFVSLGEENYSMLSEFTREKNVGFIEGLEGIIYILNSGADFELMDSSFNKFTKRGSWLKARGDRKVEPFVFKAAPETKGNLRASSLEFSCPMKSVIDNYVTEDTFPIHIEKNIHAKIGNQMHEFLNGDYVENNEPMFFLPNYILEKVGLEVRLRSEYCEKTVEYNFGGVKVSGHPDGALRVGNDLLIVDFKKGMKFYYPKIVYRDQLLTYGLALSQMNNFTPDNIYCLLLTSPFTDPSVEIPKAKLVEAYFRSQEITMWHYSKDDKAIGKLHDKILRGHEFVQGALRTPIGDLDSVGCDHCFEDTQEICKYIKNSGADTVADLLKVV